MVVIFVIIVVLASVILGLIILIQNPKGGGLSSTFGGVGNQLMGVKQTTDVLEKGTWIFASIVGVLCLTSAMFISKTGGSASETERLMNEAPVNVPTAPKTTTTPLPGAATPSGATTTTTQPK